MQWNFKVCSYMKKDVEVSINKFKAVNKADIQLNGITVLSGINGSGKSTISKLLYYTFKYANEFETIVRKFVEQKLDSIDYFAFRLSMEGRRFDDKNDDLRKLYNQYRSDEISLERKGEYLLKLFKESRDLLDIESQNQNGQDRFSKDRYIRIIKNILNIKEDRSLDDLFDEVISYVQSVFEKANKAIEDRKYAMFKQFLEEKLGASMDSICINEYGYPFVGIDVKTIPIMEYIQQVVYIDTPMFIGANTVYATDYWADLDLLLQKTPTMISSEIFIDIMEDIIHGKALCEEDSIGLSYRYHRKDGKVFDLFDSATGIKSFSILQMLLNNGSINKNTLLIIDEPEAHLHPQWIVEYARLIVLIHKHIGTKFFIASHSTDFVSAIKYIAVKEDCLDSLSYYLSEEDKGNPYMYNYRSLNTDIEPIFESFNKSFSLIDEYGADNN